MNEKRKKAKRLDAMLTWMCDGFRPFLIRPVERGGVGWTKVDCIRTTKMAIAFLRHHGVNAEPLILSALTVNQPIGKYLAETGKSINDLTGEEIRAIPEARIHRMGRLNRDEPTRLANGWRGHMAVWVNRSRFLDLTIDSVNDPPAHFVTLKPFWFEIPFDTISALAEGEGELIVRAKGGEVTSYKGDPTNDGYKDMDTWTAWHSVHDGVLRRANDLFKRH